MKFIHYPNETKIACAECGKHLRATGYTVCTRCGTRNVRITISFKFLKQTMKEPFLWKSAIKRKLGQKKP